MSPQSPCATTPVHATVDGPADPSPAPVPSPPRSIFHTAATCSGGDTKQLFSRLRLVRLRPSHATQEKPAVPYGPGAPARRGSRSPGTRPHDRPAPPPSAGPDPAATRLAYDQATPAAPGAPPSGLLASRPRARAAVSVAFATTHDARLPTRVPVNLLPLPSQPEPRDHGLCPPRPPPRPSACQWGSVPEATQRARGEAERRWRTLPRRGPRGAPAAVRPQSRCTPLGTRPSRLPLRGSFQSTTASIAEHPLQLDFLICTTGLEQNTLCSCYES